MKITYSIGLMLIAIVHLMGNYYAYNDMKENISKITPHYFNSFSIAGILSLFVLIYILITGIDVTIFSIILILFLVVLGINNIYYTILTLILKKNKENRKS